jgi:hypothetical protein
MHTESCCGKLKERNAKKEIKHSKDLSVNGNLLKWIRITMVGLGLDLYGSGQEYLAGCCGHDYEPSSLFQKLLSYREGL